MYNSEWFTSKSCCAPLLNRICVCSLLPVLYKTKQATGDFDTIIEMYDELCKDSTPMIRKAAISVIPEFIKVMDVQTRSIFHYSRRAASSFSFATSICWSATTKKTSGFLETPVAWRWHVFSPKKTAGL